MSQFCQDLHLQDASFLLSRARPTKNKSINDRDTTSIILAKVNLRLIWEPLEISIDDMDM